MVQLHVERNLRRVDLNLLVAFDVLMTERSVTRAARRLSVGQSSMSVTPRQGPNTYAARRVAGHTGARAVDRRGDARSRTTTAPAALLLGGVGWMVICDRRSSPGSSDHLGGHRR
jgi:hypothetical protein